MPDTVSATELAWPHMDLAVRLTWELMRPGEIVTDDKRDAMRAHVAMIRRGYRENVIHDFGNGASLTGAGDAIRLVLQASAK